MAYLIKFSMHIIHMDNVHCTCIYIRGYKLCHNQFNPLTVTTTTISFTEIHLTDERGAADLQEHSSHLVTV